jgi:hypothetical protein
MTENTDKIFNELNKNLDEMNDGLNDMEFEAEINNVDGLSSNLEIMKERIAKNAAIIERLKRESE